MGKTRVVFKTEVYPAMVWSPGGGWSKRRPERRTIAVLPDAYVPSFYGDPSSERIAPSRPAMAYMAEGGSRGTVSESYVDGLPDASPKESARLELELAAMGYDLEAVPWESVRTSAGERRLARPQ